jgi:hypothetical protein
MAHYVDRILKGARAGGQFAASNLTRSRRQTVVVRRPCNLGPAAQYRGLLFGPPPATALPLQTPAEAGLKSVFGDPRHGNPMKRQG